MWLAELFERSGWIDEGPMELGRQVWIELPEDPERPGVHEPFPHQIAGLGDLLAHRLRCNFDDPGTGKTLIGMAWSLYHVGLGNRVIALMPPVLLRQFKEALETQMTGADKVASWHIMSEAPADRWKLYQKWDREGWPDILMMSYQKYVSMHKPGGAFQLEVEERKLRVQQENNAEPEVVNKTKARIRRMKIQQADLSMMEKAGFTSMLCDEAKAIRGVSETSISNTYRVIKAFSMHPEHALVLMDGTPIHNTLSDAYSYMSVCDPDLYPQFASFAFWHHVYDYDEDAGRKYLVAFKEKEMLHRNFATIGRRVLKSEVFPNMKEPLVQRIRVDLAPSHRKLYRKIVKERIAELPAGERLDIETQQKLRQVCGQITVNPSAFSTKPMTSQVVDRCDELLSELGVCEGSQEKVILFAHFRSTVEYLKDYYSDFNPVVIYGGNPKRSEEARLKFLNDPTCKVLIANPLSGGVGLNFQSVCRYVVFVEPTSVPGDFKQASERVYRSGQKLLVSIYMLEARGTASVEAVDNMLRKEGDAVYVYRDDTSLLSSLLGDSAPQRRAA